MSRDDTGFGSREESEHKFRLPFAGVHSVVHRMHEAGEKVQATVALDFC